MRSIALTLALGLTAAPLMLAQAPPAAPANSERLDLVLGYWEQVMTRVQALEAECKRSTVSKRYGNIDQYEGTARFLKSPTPGQPSRASLEMRKKDNPAVIEKLVLTGSALYEYAPSTKEVRVHDLPTPKAGENLDHNLMALLFGMKVEEAKKRYEITLKGEDANYFYLEIIPRLDRDRADFAKARLSLVRTTYLPAQLWFQQANQDEVQWDLPRVNKNANHLRPADFDRPNPPPGWKLTRVPTPAPAKIRSAGN